uniref:Uncharacterized protein n=1 Tax=Aegilops tauschii subsp. strangulata TaxID=200361 RepID=A0A453GNU8_AEGTS
LVYHLKDAVCPAPAAPDWENCFCNRVRKLYRTTSCITEGVQPCLY